MSVKQQTKAKILDAAETLFAEHGFAQTSLRTITADAEVNLASVNYHFGSKQELIQEVLARYLDHLAPATEIALDKMEQNKETDLIKIFESVSSVFMILNEARVDGATLYLQLLSRCYIEGQSHLRQFIVNRYGHIIRRIERLISNAVPDLELGELFWRIHFCLGAVVFTTSSADGLNDLARIEFNQTNNFETILKRLIPFLAAGVSAPMPLTLSENTSLSD